MRALFLVSFVILSASPTSADDAKQKNQYGTITGRFLLSGKIPQRQYAVKSGDQKLKNACPKCAKTGVLSDALLIDAKSKGIANIFIYLRKVPPIHPDLRKSRQKTKTVAFKNCRLTPHAMFERTDQKIVVKNGGGVVHNVHPFPFRNPLICALIAPLKNNLNIRYQQAEPLPIPVRCDIHSWESAHWLVLDHPYAAITKPDGSFTIRNLPGGEHTFKVWHEKVGYVIKKIQADSETGDDDAEDCRRSCKKIRSANRFLRVKTRPEFSP